MAKIEFNSKVFLSPMAGITDQPMRQLVHSFGKGNLISEMVAINAVSHKNAKTYRIADVRQEDYPVVVQLVGNDENLFAETVKLIEDLGAYGIDINMGCPVKKIVNNHSGSYLMKDITKAAKIISSVRKSTTLPLSIKFRKGWDNNSINAIEFARMCEENGADYITIHGRTRSDMYSGTADWDTIAQVKQSVKIPVIGNGDIDSPQKAKSLLDYSKVDGIMVGRATLGRPWLISQIHDYLTKGEFADNPNTQAIKQIMLDHINSLVSYYGEKTAMSLSRKYVCWYCKGMHNACRFREEFIKINTMEQASEIINDFFDNLSKEEEE